MKSDFSSEWEAVLSAEKKGLPQTAQKAAKEIYRKALAQNEEQQQIKALIYLFKYRDQIEEDGLLKNIRETDSLAKDSKGVAQDLLHHLAARLYLSFANANSYRIRQRTATAIEQKEDILTWSQSRLYRHIDSLFQASLKNPSSLQAIRIGDYATLIDPGKNSLELMPTLYDLLVQETISFYQSNADKLEDTHLQPLLNNPKDFLPAEDFQGMSLTDPSPVARKILGYYQELIRFHLSDRNPKALTDIDLKRLSLVHQYSIVPEKDSLYVAALQHILHNGMHSSTPEAAVALADWYLQQGSVASGKDSEHYHDLEKALALTDSLPEGLSDKASTRLQQIRDKILKPHVALTAEAVNIPGKPFRVLVRYKNQEEIWLRIVKLESDPPSFFNNDTDASALLAKETIRTGSQRLPLPKDYQNHTAEIKIDGLKPGRYALIASRTPEFGKGNNDLVFTDFQVSGLSYLSDQTGGFLILDRETGEPVKNATVCFWNRVYDSPKRTYLLKKAGTYSSGNDGYIQTDSTEKGIVLLPEIKTKKDYLFLPNGSTVRYSGNTTPDQKPQELGLLFTDRAIYRPGQEVFFKGILYRHQPTEKDSIIPDKKVKVLLYDANHEAIDILLLKSDDFGSINGRFKLPTTTLNGNFRIAIDTLNASATFRVEAYKRPQFYMEWSKEPHQIKLGDTTSLAGAVTGFNGAPVSEAQIKYTVTRKRYYLPYPVSGTLASRTFYFPFSSETMIATGETATDANGAFTIPFRALPDLSVPEGQRIFNYEVTADVTDISGESHAYTLSVPVGDKSLLLYLRGEDKIQSHHLDSIRLNSSDLNGNFTPVNVKVSLFRLLPPQRLINKRYWDRPDQYLLTEKEFRSYFPHDEYKNEADFTNWPVSAAVFSQEDTTTETGKFYFPAGNVSSGRYLIKAETEDAFGRPVTDSQFVEIFNPKEKTLPYPEALWTTSSNLSSGLGKNLSWEIGSTEKSAIYELTEGLNYKKRIRHYQLKNRLEELQHQVSEKDRGGLSKQYATVLYNRFYIQNIRISVPDEDKSLQLSYETFRDKILPGEKETWSVKITGKDQEKVDAELLASMYDKSLDEFLPHYWGSFRNFNPYFNPASSWNGAGNFLSSPSQVIYAPAPQTYPDFSIVYPKFRDFGYPFSNYYFPYPTPRYRTMAGQPQLMVQKSVAADSRMEIQEDVTNEAAPGGQNEENNDIHPVQIRQDFRETAFFYPELRTDKKGRISFSFEAPEALTKWKLMLFGHTGDLHYVYSEKETQTQKPLMIQLNAPRFLRQGDTIVLAARLSNLSENEQNGTATLSLKSTTGDTSLPFIKTPGEVSFKTNRGENKALSWKIAVPKDFSDAITYTLTASSATFSDGEQAVIPVLSNEYFVTESLPFYFRGNGRNSLHWDLLSKLFEEHKKPEGITLEYTANPIWYAVQALPFMDEEKVESANAAFRKVYTHALSRYVALKIPGFKSIMQDWIAQDSTALQSPLQKNEALKEILLEETPWVKTAKEEAAQKALLAHWYEDKDEQLKLNTAIQELLALQTDNGGFSWFRNMPESRFVTQEIITGLGHLKGLHAWPHIGKDPLQQIIIKGVPYLDAEMQVSYHQLKKSGHLDQQNISPTDIQYLYMRSFFPDIPMEDSVRSGFNYFYNKAKTQWTKQNPALKAMLLLTFSRNQDKTTANDIFLSLKETATRDKYQGIYWKKPTGYLFNDTPVKMQSLALEAFQEINAPEEWINGMRNWLLNQKRVQYWGTTQNAADAVYALLLNGTQWSSQSPSVSIKLGDSTFTLDDHLKGAQYGKIFIPGELITGGMENIRIDISGAASDQPTWGAAYVQYFEDMDQIDHGKGSDLHIERQVTKEISGPDGKELVPVNSGESLQTGDKVQVRLVIRADRDLDFVHLKDVRASSLEPLQTLSGYQWKDGLSFYSNVKDAAVHYYFRNIPKGTFVLTYPAFATQQGIFTGGLSIIESVYAPEIRDHSEGIKIKVQ